MNRRNFILTSAGFCALSTLNPYAAWSQKIDSSFEERLHPLHRILETEDYYVWGASPIMDESGTIHVYYSRWPKKYGMGGWIHQSEIAHATAQSPEGPYQIQSIILAPRGENHWDATTCHNPHIKKVGEKYYLFYMGNSNKKTDTKRIGLAIADSAFGPWKRPDAQLLLPGNTGDWDDHCTTNPSFVQHPNGEFWLYYKSWNTSEYENYTNPKIRGNRKYGLAIAKNIEGPYTKYEGNPIINYADKGENTQAEDAFVWIENGQFNALMRDMGFYNHQYGLHLQSADGIEWNEPKIGFRETDHYFSQPPRPKHLSKYGRFERPQILFTNNKPAYLFVTSQGGKYETSSPYIFKID